MRTAPLLLAAALGVAAAPAVAHTVRVPASGGALATALATVASGDTLVLASGTHVGPVRVEHAVTLRGEPGAIVDGGGRGTVIEVTAPGAVLEDLAVRASGRRVITIDSGVRVLNAPGVRVRRVRASDVLYGVYAERSDGIVVEECELAGRVPPMTETGEGNGIHLWYTRDALLRRNRVSRFMDAIYLSFAEGAHAEGNRLEGNGRYGFHTMYCQAGVLTANTFAHNVAGCAVMFSNHLRVAGNLFQHNRGPRTYGLLLRDCSDGAFTDNRLVDNTIAVFMDNSNRNRLTGNLVQDNGWGVLLYSSCAGNVFAANSFINDEYPVALDMRRTDNRFDDGRRGNYWSENTAYDLDGDGVSDAPWSPVSAFAFLSKQYPDLSVLAKSPAVAALGVAERVFPALRASEAVDRFPLVSPPHAAGAAGRAPRPARAPARGALLGFCGLLGVGALGLARRGSAR
ncbi:MAG: nitrous oxide reductase family maturation protein NosD [Candidatus Eisenbacteria bacterium]|nr:nitrous oxide reductase family maturation protein NosD [Candidatus Eisenbacteria bacterium]